MHVERKNRRVHRVVDRIAVKIAFVRAYVGLRLSNHLK